MKIIFENPLWIVLPLFLAVVSSCKDGSNPISDPDKIVFPDTLVSFKMHVQPLFNITCTTSECHDGTNQGVLPNLTYYEGVRFGPPVGLVSPRDPESSILVKTIEQSHGPLPLNANHIRGIRQWIKEGALNN